MAAIVFRLVFFFHSRLAFVKKTGRNYSSFVHKVGFVANWRRCVRHAAVVAQRRQRSLISPRSPPLITSLLSTAMEPKLIVGDYEGFVDQLVLSPLKSAAIR